MNDIKRRRDDREVEVKECKKDQNTAAEALAQYASSMVTDLHVIYERPHRAPELSERGQSSPTTQQQESGVNSKPPLQGESKQYCKVDPLAGLPPLPSRGQSGDERRQKKDLYRAICDDNWNKAKQILDQNPQFLTPVAPSRTPLHVAAMIGHVTVVDKLVELPSSESFVNKVDSNGYTALALASWYSGKNEVVDSLLRCEENNRMACIATKHDELPVVLAFDTNRMMLGHKLYSRTPLDRITNRQGAKLLRILIQTQCFGLALDLLQHHRGLLLVAINDEGWTPIYEIATLNTAILSPSELRHRNKLFHEYLRT
ncbi:uncharacterized protein LOC114721414 [Neltuma alba]|uniref:uncharacterized protein LOC114721414 n=1 Tax=Neltuma alba TaxID=207710 RepID=UPI0010A3CE15|nr:uncharacterized protein LOC114721414 [Prosopis alba]